MSKVFRLYRIKQIQSTSKQYSTIDWTDKTLSKNDISKGDDDKSKKNKSAKSKEDDYVTPYMHQQFINTYIVREGAKEENDAINEKMRLKR